MNRRFARADAKLAVQVAGVRLDCVHRQKQLVSDLPLREVSGEQPQDRELGGRGRLNGLLRAGARLVQSGLGLLGESSQSPDVGESVELFAGDFELRCSEREPAACDTGLGQNKQRMNVVQAWLKRAAQGLRALELALSIVRLSELEQSLAESVVRHTRRQDAGQAKLA